MLKETGTQVRRSAAKAFMPAFSVHASRQKALALSNGGHEWTMTEEEEEEKRREEKRREEKRRRREEKRREEKRREEKRREEEDVPLLFYSPSSRREKGKTGEAVGSEKRNE